MDKRLDFTGINPDIRLDQILIDANANRPAMFAMLESYAVGTNPNYKVSGCVVTVGGSSPANTWSLTAGYIYLNNELIQVNAQSGTFDEATQFLALSKSITYDPKGDITYNDGITRQTWQVNRGVVTVKSSVLNTELDAINGDNLDNKIKDYVGDASTANKGVVIKATSPEADAGTPDRYIDAALLADRMGGAKIKIIEIGDWDMDTISNILVPHGLTFDQIINASAFIRSDASDFKASIDYNTTSLGVAGAITVLDNTSIGVFRSPSGFYDSTDFNSTGYNRGWIHILYLP